VITNATACGTSLNHGVAIFGYGTQTGNATQGPIDYYLVRNSWGSGWGDNGYVRIATN